LIPHGLHSWNAWVVADLDGDHHSDWAVARRTNLNGAEYSQEIQLHLSTSPTATVLVRTSAGPHRLIARDLDGDTDRDIVLEGFDRSVVAVLVNDGAGHFHQADLGDYQFRLTHPDRADWETLSRDSDSGATIDSPSTGGVAQISGSRCQLEPNGPEP